VYSHLHDRQMLGNKRSQIRSAKFEQDSMNENPEVENFGFKSLGKLNIKLPTGNNKKPRMKHGLSRIPKNRLRAHSQPMGGSAFGSRYPEF